MQVFSEKYQGCISRHAAQCPSTNDSLSFETLLIGKRGAGEGDFCIPLHQTRIADTDWL